MKFKYVFFLLILPFLAELVISCCDCPSKPEEYHYTTREVVLYSYDDSDSDRTYLKDTIGFDNFRITTYFHFTTIVSVPDKFSLFNSAYATSKCNCEMLNFRDDRLTAFQVISTSDFDAAHPANSDVSDLFLVEFLNETLSISDYLTKYGNYFSPKDSSGNPMELKLKSKPDHAGKFSFKVVATTSTGKTLQDQTEERYLY